jgi:hypothetical protein
MSAYTRKTRDTWEIWVRYGMDWEHETTELSLADARAQLRCYRANVSHPVKLIKRRERIVTP